MLTLKETLFVWEDVDIAEHALALCLGLAPQNSSMKDFKSLYWSVNSLGMDIVKILNDLVSAGFLLKRDEPDLQYKWSGKYDVLYIKAR